jgi:hypothetical protein
MKTFNRSKYCLLAFLFLVVCLPLNAIELLVELHYPTRTDEVLLTGIDGNFLVFRPKGQDDGGRAYLDIEDLKRQKVTINYLLSEQFYKGIERLNENRPIQALPLFEAEAGQLLEYNILSKLPGNYSSTVLPYMDALQQSRNWNRLVALIVEIPVADSPTEIVEKVGDVAFALHAQKRFEDLDIVHKKIISIPELAPEHVASIFDIANSWRQAKEYQKAYDVYRLITANGRFLNHPSVLWAAYCGFYCLGNDSLEKIYSKLPEIDAGQAYFSLRRLLDTRWYLQLGDYPSAMRYAAQGKVYANATEPWYPELIHTLAVLYTNMNLVDEGSLAHSEVSAIFPNSRWAKKSLQLLKDQK